MSAPKESAVSAYETAAILCHARLQEIASIIEDMPAPDTTDITWSEASRMMHFADQLRRTLDNMRP